MEGAGTCALSTEIKAGAGEHESGSRWRFPLVSLLNARSSTPLQRRHCLREDTAYGKDCLLNIRKADERQKNLPAMQKTRVQSLGQEDPLENGVATHSSILAWEILWTEEPGRLQTTESQRVRHN